MLATGDTRGRPRSTCPPRSRGEQVFREMKGTAKATVSMGYAIHDKDRSEMCEMPFRHKLQIDHRGGVGLSLSKHLLVVCFSNS